MSELFMGRKWVKHSPGQVGPLLAQAGSISGTREQQRKSYEGSKSAAPAPAAPESDKDFETRMDDKLLKGETLAPSDFERYMKIQGGKK